MYKITQNWYLSTRSSNECLTVKWCNNSSKHVCFNYV